MSAFLWLMIATIPQNNQKMMPEPIFQGMLDSAPMVVIARVKNIWYSLDTISGELNGQPYTSIMPYTHVSAEVLSAYSKDSTLVPAGKTVHICYGGGMISPGYWLHVTPSVTFSENEMFLAPISIDPHFTNSGETVYNVSSERWKYTIADDSIFYNGKALMSLGEAITSLSTHFPIRGEK